MRSLAATVLASFVVLSVAAGCAAPSDSAAEAAAPATEDGADNEVVGTDRTGALNGLRARVGADFAGAASLRTMKLVFKVHRFNTDGKKAAVQARIMKRDASGKDSELAAGDFEGSAYEEAIREGFFDGPEVTAVLQKSKDGVWTIMAKGTGENAMEAYVVGPTDVAYTEWPTEFGVPSAWLGL